MDYEDISKKLDEIEAELRKQGINIPGDPMPKQVRSAFGGAEMAVEQWLASVFLPAARKSVADRDLPKGSQVGVAAMRNFDGHDEKEYLVSLLFRFDQVVETVARQSKSSR